MSTDFSRIGGAPAQATAQGTPASRAIAAAVRLSSRPTGRRVYPRRRAQRTAR